MKRKLTSLLIAGMLLSSSSTPVFAEAKSFPDVNPTLHSWAVNSIQFMSEKGIVVGDEQGRFNPDAKVTKAEFVSMVHRLLDKYRSENDSEIQYIDVPKNHWAYAAITDIGQLMDYGHYSYSTGQGIKFDPEQPLTRLGAANLIPEVFNYVDDQEVYTIVAGMRDFKIVNANENFNDNRYEEGVDMTNSIFPLVFYKGNDGTYEPDDDYTYMISTKVASLQKLGLMTAYNGSFEAADPLTRAEAVTILHRLYNYLSNSGKLAEYSTK